MRKPLFFSLSAVIVILALLLANTARALPSRSFPQIDGQIRLAGLDGPVDVYRDNQGIPHIYATTTHDLFFAQGYVHAQDRFWQMDFWRHIGSGRLSEMFGKSQLETDIFLRTLGWARVAQQELDHLDASSKSVLDAYAAGVNAYLADHKGEALSLEYAVMKLTNSSYQVEPWTPLHSLTWAKAMAWDLRGNMDEEGDRTQLLKVFTKEQVDELYPSYPEDRPVIVPNPPLTALPSASGTIQSSAAAIPADLGAQIASLKDRSVALDELIGPSGVGVGSNNWVISGKLTNTGKPLLANDPHLGAQMPSIWYEIGLHCVNKSDACPIEVTGFSFASAPGVVIGHNDRIAWGVTNVGPDVQDIYIEKINPQNPNQYEVNGQWVDMLVLHETIQVAGGKPVDLTVRYTRHGPVIWDDAKQMEETRANSGIQLPEQYRLALHWTALEESRTFPALWKIDQAQNWEEFRAGVAMFDVPAQNFIYADVDGNIGYQTPGKVPIRTNGDGRYYVPGWTDDYEWQGYIPFDELPRAYNPPEGFIVTANNAVVGKNYPYLITTDWDYGFRAQRITDLISGAPGPIDIAYIQKIQGDDRNLSAEYILPPLMQLTLNDAHLEKARAIFNGWDGQQSMQSAQGALYAVFWKNLVTTTFREKLPEKIKLDGGPRWYEIMRRLVQQPNNSWWDLPSTAVIETRDDVYRKAFTAAVAELEKLQGKDPARWNWGKLHTITFANQTFGESGIAPIEALFNRGPYPTAGGEGIINATGWNVSKGYEVDWLPSMRMIVDLSNFNNSLTVNTTGQSGHAYHPHYTDLIDLWRNIQYHPMRWSEADTQTGGEGHLRLMP